MSDAPAAKRPKPDTGESPKVPARPAFVRRGSSRLSVDVLKASLCVEQARVWFDKHDHDGNGVLDTSEFRGLLKSIGSDHDKLHPKYVEHFLKVTDRDGDGAVTLEDFTKAHTAAGRALAPQSPPESAAPLAAGLRQARSL